MNREPKMPGDQELFNVQTSKAQPGPRLEGAQMPATPPCELNTNLTISLYGLLAGV